MFPAFESAAAFDTWFQVRSNWAELAPLIAQPEALLGSFVPAANGSTVVWLSASQVIKLFPPLPGYQAAYERESTTLRALAGQLPVSAPVIQAQGQCGDWSYFVTPRVCGVALDELWPSLDRARRLDLARQLGELVAALHGVCPARVGEISDDWASFRARQRELCLARERGRGLVAARCREVELFLQQWDQLRVPEFPPAILHTELGPSHVLVNDDRISGIIDFGDAMVGDPEYDHAVVALMITQGDARALRAYLEAYAGPYADDPQRIARWLGHVLMHRYGTLAWYLSREAPTADSLEVLAQHWFGLARDHHGVRPKSPSLR